MKTLKISLKILLIIVILIAIFFVILIGYAYLSDYKPAEKEEVSLSKNAQQITDSLTFNILTWNIGYCGLNKEMDFFYDGGLQVYTTEEQTKKNMNGIIDFLKKNDSIDFFLLQEVDKDSKRSYHINEYEEISKALASHHAFFGKNYDVFFVPVPFSKPMGKVLSGISTFSRNIPQASIRYSFPGEYSFPKQLFLLDRCFLVNRYNLSNGKELLIINTHNEAFDPGDIRKAQMDYLKNFLNTEYSKGNYIVVGGDWNQCPPKFNANFTANKLDTIEKMDIPANYLPDQWKWIFDNSVPTNRRVKNSYNPENTLTTLIDFFLISPNIEQISTKGIHLGFENSDHNPVIISLKLKK